MELTVADDDFDINHGYAGLDLRISPNMLWVDVAKMEYVPVSALASHVTKIDNDGAYRGFLQLGANNSSMSPATYGGQTINYFACNISGTVTLRLAFVGGVQLAGVTTITATFLDGGLSPVVMTWNGGNARYQSSGNSAINTYLATKNGHTIGVTFS